MASGNPDGTVTRQTYDERGNRTSVTAPTGLATHFTYDDAGRLVLKFQTIVPVDAGDELFIDYCLTADDGSPPTDYPCRCGSSNCRGTMLAPADAA